jgi:pimeloyl-ACP methyl ester carboxylesterase
MIVSTGMVERRCILSAFSVTSLLALTGCAAALNAGFNCQAAIEGLEGFHSRTARVNGAHLHYVCGGAGPMLFLVHGFPQDWFAFHDVMARLAKRYTVVAIDMRGIGGSSGPIERYDPTILDRDLLELARHLGSDSLYIAGHDNGGMVAYIFARAHPNMTRAAFILDAPLPGIEPWANLKAEPELWHFGFHQTPALPELLVGGHQQEYFRAFFNRLTHNPGAITDADVAHYARAYGTSEQLRAGFAFYRQCYPAIETSNRLEYRASNVPLILVGGDRSIGPLNAQIADGLRQRGWQNIAVETIGNAGHWIVDEQPQAIAAIIERHAHA